MNYDITKLIENGNWTAVQQAQKAGPPIIDAIEPYLNHADDVIRLLTVDCIAVAGGPKAPGLLIKALSDENEHVRINAVNGLHKQLPAQNKESLLEAWDKTHDNYARQQIPMIYGRIGDPSVIPELTTRLKTVNQQPVHDGFIAALAKLDFKPARAEFAELLKKARGEEVKNMIDYVKYIDDPWILPHLRPVMDRHEEAIDMSSHRTKVIRRGCDLATDEVIRISKHPFSFPVNPIEQYSDGQLMEIIRYLDPLVSQPK